MFNSNVAPVRVVKEAVKRGPWTCECERAHHPGLKRCGTCGEARPNTNGVMSATPRQLEKADYPALLTG